MSAEADADAWVSGNTETEKPTLGNKTFSEWRTQIWNIYTEQGVLNPEALRLLGDHQELKEVCEIIFEMLYTCVMCTF